MNQTHLRRRVLGLGLPALALVSSLGLANCKKAATGSSAGPAASGSAGTATASGPCGTYASRLCEKAGPDTPTCQAIKTTTDLMPPDACTAGLKDVEYTAKKLASAHKVCDELVQKLCAAIGPETQSCQLVTTETKKFPPERCKAMLEHQDEVVTELRNMEKQNQPLSPELQTAIVETPGAAAFGPANAKVTVVEFSDFQCPYCSRAANVVHQIKEKYGDKVHFVFRQFPLPMHQNAHVAAEAALAANGQGKFWEYHDRLFKNQQQLDRAGLEEQAKQAGLNMATFKKSLDEHKFAPTVDADMKLGESVQVQGTPSMFINGARVQNPTSFESVSEMIETALKGGGGTTPG
jgi:protein-disulfide isomerase